MLPRRADTKSGISYLVDIALIVSLCLLFFWRDLTPVQTDRWTLEPGDFYGQFYAFAHYEASRLHSGQLPLWDPYTYAGHPFLADIQAAVFYPLSLLSVLLTATAGFSYRALELEALAHFPIAGIATYLLARRLTGSRIGGLVAAFTFTFSGYLTSYPPLQLAVLETQAWLPLILLLVDLAAERIEQGAAWAATRWAVGAGLVLGVSFLAGHPQSGMLVAYATLAYGLFRLWPRSSHPAYPVWPWRAAVWALVLLIGLGTAAAQLVPSLEFTAISGRVGLGFEEAGTGFTPYDLVQLILPAVGGRVPALYVGVLPLGLVVLALTASRRPTPDPAESRTVTFLGWTILISLLLSFGKYLGLYFVAYLLIPGWSLFRDQERTVVLAVLAAALLSGYAAAWLERRWAAGESGSLDQPGPNSTLHNQAQRDRPVSRKKSPDRRLALGYGIAAMSALVLTLAFFVGYQAGNDQLWGFTAASLTLTMFFFLAALAIRSRQPALLLALLVLDLFTYNPAHHARPATDLDLSPHRLLLQVPLLDQGTFRMANEGALPGNYGLLYGLEDVGGASPLVLKRYQELQRTLAPACAWRLLNVKYVVSWRESLDVPSTRLAEEPGSDGKPIYLYRLEDMGPRAWLVGQAIEEADQQRLLQRLAAPDFDPTQQVLLSQIPAGFNTPSRCDGDITWLTREPERITLDASTIQPCFLVLSEIDYPGWAVAVDGVASTILRADAILRAVALPPGRHTVSFRFWPALVPVGAVVSILTLVLSAAWLVLGHRVFPA